MTDALLEKWKSPVITGEEHPRKPDMIAFNNTVAALDLIHNHLSKHSKIAVHCDVDMDGIGCGYIIKKFLSYISQDGQAYFINNTKEHGIKPRHVDFFRKKPVDLLIIVDSSSNELETIKQFECDVLVIDHHEILHSEYLGFTNDFKHQYVIVNNMISNKNVEMIETWVKKNNPNSKIKLEPYVADSRMSCGLVVYELLRVFQEAFNTGPILENTMLYQWAGVTLFTDAILLATERNQWYIENTVHSTVTEPTLLTMAQKLNRYNYSLSKSLINYTIAPVINKAIRAGDCGSAMSAVLWFPDRIDRLLVYKEKQENAVSAGITSVDEHDTFVMKDITDTGVTPSYTGVIASRLCDDYRKNAVVYTVVDGIAKGSFRGRKSGIDYRLQFESFEDGVYAQGHKQAFGFQIEESKLCDVMNSLAEIEGSVSIKPYLTAGNWGDKMHGEFHIDDMDEFRKAGNLVRLAMGNSKVSSEEQIMITVPNYDAKLVETRGKLYIYDVLGLNCKAFKELTDDIVNIYAEYDKTIEFYAK